MPADDFRRGVGDRSHEFGGRGRRCGRGGDRRGTEIEDDDTVDRAEQIVAGDHDVGRFDVAVDDSVLVGVVESLGDPGADDGDLIDRRGFFVEADAVDEVHCAPRYFALDPVLVDGDDAGVAKSRDGAGHREETLIEVGIVDPCIVVDQLEGDTDMLVRVIGQIYLTHSADAERGNDGVPREV